MVAQSAVTTRSVTTRNIRPVAAGITSPRATATLERRRLWERRYRHRLRTSDSLIVMTAVFGTQVITTMLTMPAALSADPLAVAAMPVLVGAVWLATLGIFRTREPGDRGAGATEYTRVLQASTFAFGLLAIAFVLFDDTGLRSQLLFALPVGVIALLIGRWCWRKWLNAQRRFGHYVSRTVVVGSRSDVEYVLSRLTKPELGHLVVGTILTDENRTFVTVDGRRFPAIGGADTVARTAERLSADSIIVASTPDDDPDFVKRLSWELEGTAAELILSSRLTDVAGPRITLRPVDGLPLIKVRIPRFEGSQFAVKRAGDILASLFGILVVAAIAVPIAIAVKLDSRGPVFFGQERVGRDGRTFTMLKFRTMRVNAEQELAALVEQNEGAGPLFKMRDDPRVTRVGRFLRKVSLDELPQLWNILRGDMSLVGPRPPLPSEVVAYDGTVVRRLYIKPGLTGLWQISGRSDLSWDESVRLDLRYVENWSLITDLMIVFRTVKTVLHPNGAY